MDPEFENHTFTILGLDGRILGTNRANLLEVISDKDRYIVDSNSGWMATAAKKENAGKAFIIGPTFLKENHNTESVLFGPDVKTENKNVFVLYPISDPAGLNHEIRLHLLEPDFRFVFDEKSFAQNKIKPEHRTVPWMVDWHTGNQIRCKSFRRFILKMLNVHDLTIPESQDDAFEFVNKLRSRLYEGSDSGVTRGLQQCQAWIQTWRTQCTLDFMKSGEIASMCYLLLLTKIPKICNEFLGPNAFGDSEILQNALFLDAKIFSGDKPLKKMAGYVGIQCSAKI